MVKKRTGRGGKREALWRRHIRAFAGLLLILIGVSIIFHTLSINQVSFFDGEHRFTLVLNTPDVALLTLEPKMKRAALVTIASNIEARPPRGGEGAYQIGKVYALGAFDKKGGLLLKDTLQFLVGVPIDGWIAFETKDAQCQRADKLFSLQCVGFLLQGSFLGRFDTNLTPLDIVGIFLSLQGMRDRTEFRQIALVDQVAYDEQTLPDGATVLHIKEASLDSFAKEFFQDQEFLTERLSVSILNGTGIQGFGNAFARILSNSGIDIVSVTTPANANEAQTLVEVSKKRRNSYTVQKIAHVFALPIATADLLKEDIRLTLGR